MRPVILDVGGGTGEWSRFYRLANYDVIIIDPIFYPYETAAEFLEHYDGRPIRGVLMAPPCTEFSLSGARWWGSKPPELLEEAIEIVREFLSVKDVVNPDWWALENPVGRLGKVVPELGKWSYTFQPYDFGDPYSKRTCIWGDHMEPVKNPVAPVEGSKLWKLGPGPNRAFLRGITPQGFAKAFFEANP